MSKKQNNKNTNKKQTGSNAQKHPFLSAFSYTENGKPKSTLFLYTFCLSFVYIAVYVLALWAMIELLSKQLQSAGVDTALNNTIVSVAAGILASILCNIPHFLFKDKRMSFATYAWLAFYVVAAVIAMMIIQPSLSLLLILCWFAVIPVTIGFIIALLLFRKDYKPEVQQEKKEEWTQYINRR